MTSVLVVAAHPDDEVLGCGGYIAARVKSRDEVIVVFLSDGVTSRDENLGILEIEARRHAAILAAKFLGLMMFRLVTLQTINSIQCPS